MTPLGPTVRVEHAAPAGTTAPSPSTAYPAGTCTPASPCLVPSWRGYGVSIGISCIKPARLRWAAWQRQTPCLLAPPAHHASPAGVSDDELLRHLVYCFDYNFHVLDTRQLPQGARLAADPSKGQGSRPKLPCIAGLL